MPRPSCVKEPTAKNPSAGNPPQHLQNLSYLKLSKNYKPMTHDVPPISAELVIAAPVIPVPPPMVVHFPSAFLKSYLSLFST
jgi:hypothetical protein